MKKIITKNLFFRIYLRNNLRNFPQRENLWLIFSKIERKTRNFNLSNKILTKSCFFCLSWVNICSEYIKYQNCKNKKGLFFYVLKKWPFSFKSWVQLLLIDLLIKKKKRLMKSFIFFLGKNFFFWKLFFFFFGYENIINCLKKKKANFLRFFLKKILVLFNKTKKNKHIFFIFKFLDPFYNFFKNLNFFYKKIIQNYFFIDHESFCNILTIGCFKNKKTQNITKNFSKVLRIYFIFSLNRKFKIIQETELLLEKYINFYNNNNKKKFSNDLFFSIPYFFLDHNRKKIWNLLFEFRFFGSLWNFFDWNIILSYFSPNFFFILNFFFFSCKKKKRYDLSLKMEKMSLNRTYFCTIFFPNKKIGNFYYKAYSNFLKTIIRWKKSPKLFEHSKKSIKTFFSCFYLDFFFFFYEIHQNKNLSFTVNKIYFKKKEKKLSHKNKLVFFWKKKNHS